MLTLPPSFLHVTLTTPYRSTRAITSLARFIAKCSGLDFSEGECGSDVEGNKPTLFEVGAHEQGKLEELLARCHSDIGDDATIIYKNISMSMRRIVKQQGKEAGGPWDCHCAWDYTGWEADKVVAVTDGREIMEVITRARTDLCVIIVGDRYETTIKQYFCQAAEEGLIEIK